MNDAINNNLLLKRKRNWEPQRMSVNPSRQEAKAGVSTQAQGQTGLHRETI